MNLLIYLFPKKLRYDLRFYSRKDRDKTQKNIIRKCLQIPNVKQVLLFGGKKFTPGTSDIDLLLVIENGKIFDSNLLENALPKDERGSYLLLHPPYVAPERLVNNIIIQGGIISRDEIFQFDRSFGKPTEYRVVFNHDVRTFAYIDYHLVRTLFQNQLFLQNKGTLRDAYKTISGCLIDATGIVSHRSFSEISQFKNRKRIKNLATRYEVIKRKNNIFNERQKLQILDLVNECTVFSSWLMHIYLSNCGRSVKLMRIEKYTICMETSYGFLCFIRNYSDLEDGLLIRLLKVFRINLFDLTVYEYIYSIQNYSGINKSSPLYKRGKLLEDWYAFLKQNNLLYATTPPSMVMFREYGNPHVTIRSKVLENIFNLLYSVFFKKSYDADTKEY